MGLPIPAQYPHLNQIYSRTIPCACPSSLPCHPTCIIDFLSRFLGRSTDSTKQEVAQVITEERQAKSDLRMSQRIHQPPSIKETSMVKEQALAKYLEALLRGDRRTCRNVVEETLQSGIPTNSVYLHLIWPVMVEIERLLRTDKITVIQEHLATRINRTLVDQLQNKLPPRPAKHNKGTVGR